MAKQKIIVGDFVHYYTRVSSEQTLRIGIGPYPALVVAIDGASLLLRAYSISRNPFLVPGPVPLGDKSWCDRDEDEFPRWWQSKGAT
jgi:hypothetical protein